MIDNDLDRVLMEREEVVPSSGFVAAVMEAVQQEADASAPVPFPPIPFPWKWALPGLMASVALAVGLIVRWIFSGARVGSSAGSATTTALPVERISSLLPHAQIAQSTVVALEWSAVALLLSLAAVWFSMRIATGGE
ncbi:MAG: hypothetical protein ACYCOR_08520 [Acidobacteriaceae bacterium]